MFEKHPIVILKDVRFVDLKSIIDFMYRGEVNVAQDQLSSLLKTAETLKVKGLAEVGEKQSKGHQVLQSSSSRSKKRKRNRAKANTNQPLSDSGETSEEDDTLPNKFRHDNNNLLNYGGLQSGTQSRQPSRSTNFPSKNISESVQNCGSSRTSNLKEIEPIKLLEQSMSTSEVLIFLYFIQLFLRFLIFLEILLKYYHII